MRKQTNGKSYEENIHTLAYFTDLTSTSIEGLPSVSSKSPPPSGPKYVPIKTTPVCAERQYGQAAQAESKKPEESAHPTPHSVVKSRTSETTKDLMISYSHADNDIMSKVRDTLEANGISVWVDVSGLGAGVDFLSKIGQAIIDCKLFLTILSKSSVESKYCQDELALAYVSDRAIFPFALDEPAELKASMTTGMKLQLASYEWVILGRDPEKFDERFGKLLANLKDELLRQQKEAMEKTKQEAAEKSSDGSRPPLVRQNTRHNLNKKKRQQSATNLAKNMDAQNFWKNHFGVAEHVAWPKFVECFKEEYKEELDGILNEEEQVWLMTILSREMEVMEDEELYKYNILAFSNVDGEYLPLWERVQDQAREDLAMKEVFDMESSVRVEAIENLGKFRSAAVIDALRDLLSDPDANARAVAAVSLARTNAMDPVTSKFLMKTLNDKDRLVREAGCLALGHLRVKQAVSKLLHMWRNDVISHVREAANVALNQIGGPEVEKAMRVTKVLADEIRQLTTS